MGLEGREELLARLDSWLTHSRPADGASGAGPRIVVLCGLGGVGKTSLAVEYAHRHEAELSLIWQVSAEDPTLMLAAFGDLAAQLGVRDVLDAADPVARVHGVLAALTGEWLLLLDNAADPSVVRAVLPPAGKGRVLITSQNPHWPAGQVLEVPVLDRQAAARFLQARTGTADQATVWELAGELDGLPLALEQAAAYMKATGRDIAGYRALYRERQVDLLARGDPGSYDKRVSTTWALAYARLEHAESAAVGLLRLLACCAPEAVPLDLLLGRPIRAGYLDPQVVEQVTPLLEGPLAVDDAIIALRTYSLLSSPRGGTVSMHRLVQAVTLAQLTPDQAAAWRETARLLIDTALPDDPERPQSWPAYAALLPHAQALLPPDGDGLARVANYLGHSGGYAASLALHQGILARRETVLGGDHPRTLTARADLARWTGEVGDPSGARDQFVTLAPTCDAVLGPLHPQTLAARRELAKWTGDAGDAAGARDQCAALVPVCASALGDEAPGTLITKAHHAFWSGAAGDARGACAEFAALLPSMERVFGADHPEVLAGRDNRAAWTMSSGDPAGARDQYTALVPLCTRVLGAEHPRTLGIRELLARCTAMTGDHAGARDQFAALLPVGEEILGAEHPNVLTTRADLAYWTGMAGDATRARDQFAALVLVRERVLGAAHPDTLTARADLAYWTGMAGDATRARDQQAALIPAFVRVMGEDHPETLFQLADLALLTGLAGDAAGARDGFAKVVPKGEQVLGAEHPDRLIWCADLARWTGEAGDAAGARDQLAVFLPRLESALGAGHPEALKVRTWLEAWTERAARTKGR